MARHSAAVSLEAAITRHLTGNAPQRPEEIRAALKADGGTISAALNRMFKAGTLKRWQQYGMVKTPYGKKMTMRNRYALVEGSP